MKINPMATLGGILMIFSLFLPWVMSDSWWFQSEGNLKDLMEKSFHEIASYNFDDFGRKEAYQVLGIMICFFYLIIGGIVALSQIKWAAHVAAVLGISGLLFYTLITLDFLGAISYNTIGFGYYIAWVGTILTGIGGE